ncbi:DNA polymerase [Serratia phage vB_SmaM-Kashira]|nr:DNA polymerase [Serratia phage vB_SmaM-Kashira]
MSEENKVPGKVIMKCLAGSKAYGTSVPTSDTDIRGIFVAEPKAIRTPWYTVGEYTMPDEEDGKLYELNKFMELFVDMNPNIIELMFVRESEILFSTPEYWELRRHAHALLSSKVAFKFSGYAMAQLKRIKGHDKWINNPQPVEVPSQLEFFRMVNNYTEEKILKHKDFMDVLIRLEGLASLIPLGNWLYGVVFDYRESVPPMFNPDGSIRKIAYEDIPDDIKKRAPLFIVKYLSEDHKLAKEKHRNYWTWKENRNASRHELEVKFGYDTKHAMHLVRLMRMAREILETGEVHVWRPDHEELVGIRNGSLDYDTLIEWAEMTDEYVRGEAYQNTKLPKKVDLKLASDILLKVQDMAWRN